MKKLKINMPLFHCHAFGSPKTVEMCGSACEGLLFPQGRLPIADSLPDGHFQKRVLGDYLRDYRKAYGQPPTTFGAQAYDAIWLVLNAMKQKSVTPFMDVTSARALVRDGIEQTTNWVGTCGVFNMSPTDHVGLDKDRSLDMLQVRDGKIVLFQMTK